MANYYVVLREGPQNSSDAAIGTKPTGTSEVLAAALKCVLVNVSSSSSEADARIAARVAYGAETTPLACTEANLT